jgi:hypothetical protein
MEMKMNINRFLAAMAVATTLGSPALAQSYDPDLGTGNIAPAPTSYVDTAPGINAFAQAPRAEHKRNRSELNRSDAVVDENGNVEADPDINIRSQLQREDNSGF